MALHTSTIVLAVITAVPFGLAIKDTVQGKTPYGSLMGDVSEDDSESDESFEAARREYEEREAKEKEERDAAIASLFSTEAGKLNLSGFALGRELKLDTAEQELLEARAHAVFRPSRTNDETLRSLTISFPQYGDNEVCDLVGEKLEERWGTPKRTYGDDSISWHYTTTTTTPPQRVTFVDPGGSERCQLVLEQHVLPADFVNKTPASTVPLWALGKPAAKLVEQLGDDAFSDATQIRWTALGVGAGLGTTELYARVVKGKIVTVTAKFNAASNDTLVEHLDATYGESTITDVMTWKAAKISLSLVDESTGDHLLVAGEPLPEESDDSGSE
jgi:hypothetical protein